MFDLSSSPPGQRALASAIARHAIPLELDLLRNAKAYPEMADVLRPAEARAVALISKTLLGLPLVHSTSLGPDVLRSDIVPFDLKPDDRRGHSQPLDEDLGLTGFTFMHWGAVEKSSYGRNHVLIDARLLLDARTVATPRDIHADVIQSDPYAELTPENRARVVTYFESMVTGKDWLEITARRLLSEVREGRAPSLDHQAKFGEVKFFGPIPQGSLMQYVDPEGERGVWAEQLRKGFVPGPVHRAQSYGSSGYDPTPEQLGLPADTAFAHWRSLLPAEVIAPQEPTPTSR